MTISKLPSGSYRIQLMENGVRKSITVPYKPSQKQAYELIRERFDHPEYKYSHMTFEDAGEAYRRLKDAVLSPSTIRGYQSNLKNLPESFKKLTLDEIDSNVVQQVINDLAKHYSVKYVRNLNGYIMSVMNQYIPGNKIHTTLPARQKKPIYIPTEEDVQRLLEYCYHTEYWVPLSLACLSLRRSEICALTVDDLDGNILTINKALVPDENNNMVLKNTTKTEASTRQIILPDELADRIRSQGYVFKNTPNSIDQYLRRNLPKLGIPQFSPHKLRHFFASYMSGRYTTEQIMAAGGWESDFVLKHTYTHVMQEEEAKKSMAMDMSKLFRVQ